MTAKGAILVTGANRGLGLGLTREFLRRGWRVYAGCRIPEGATALRQLAGERGEELRIVALDVRSDTGVAAAMSEIARDAHGLDVLVNNAGINPGPRDCRIDEIPLARVAEAMEVNLLGTLRVLQAALPLLRRTVHPRVVNISSGAGSLSRNASRWRQPAYCLSKAALNMLTRRAARRAGRQFCFRVAGLDPDRHGGAGGRTGCRGSQRRARRYDRSPGARTHGPLD